MSLKNTSQYFFHKYNTLHIEDYVHVILWGKFEHFKNGSALVDMAMSIVQ